MRLNRLFATAALVAMLLVGNQRLEADQIRFEVENPMAAGGFYFTPLFLGFHNGSFDVFDSGGMASNPLETLAETGNTTPLSNLLLATQSTARAETLLGDSMGPPPFDPTEIVSTVYDLDTTDQRFFNYASMVIPTNDAFFGNSNAIELFDASGNFVGPSVIEITAAMIYDAGTELNDATVGGGAAFVAGEDANNGVDQNNAISFIPLSDLNDFVGVTTAAGTQITTPLAADTVIARFTLTAVPEPGSIGLLGLVAFAGLMRRRR